MIVAIMIIMVPLLCLCSAALAIQGQPRGNQSTFLQWREKRTSLSAAVWIGAKYPGVPLVIDDVDENTKKGDSCRTLVEMFFSENRLMQPSPTA